MQHQACKEPRRRQAAPHLVRYCYAYFLRLDFLCLGAMIIIWLKIVQFFFVLFWINSNNNSCLSFVESIFLSSLSIQQILFGKYCTWQWKQFPTPYLVGRFWFTGNFRGHQIPMKRTTKLGSFVTIVLIMYKVCFLFLLFWEI